MNLSETVLVISEPAEIAVITDTPAPSEIVQTIISEVVVLEKESFQIVEIAAQGKKGADGAAGIKGDSGDFAFINLGSILDGGNF